MHRDEVHARIIGFALLISWAPPGFLRAQPLVRVRAETLLEVHIERDRDRVAVSGSLHDDLGQPLGSRALRLRLDADPSDMWLETDEHGLFRGELTVPEGNWWIDVVFEGDDLHLRRHIRREISVHRAAVQLTAEFDGQPILDLDRPIHTLSVHARSEAGGEGLQIVVRHGDSQLAQGRTDRHGVVQLTIRTSSLGEPGGTRFVIRSEPDAHRADGQIELPVLRFRPTTLSLSSTRSVLEGGDGIDLAGELTTSQGGLGGKAIGVWAGARHLATALTHADGKYRASIDPSELDDLEGEIVARFESDAPGWGSSVAPAITVRRNDVGGWRSAWIVGSVVVTALIVAVAGRRRTASGSGGVSVSTKGALEYSKKSRLVPDCNRLRGQVRDAERDSEVSMATLRISEHSTIIAESGTNSHGEFAFDALPAGQHRVDIAAPGYAPTTFRVTVPHRGEWSSVVIRMESLRTLAWKPLEPIAALLLPSPDLWGIWTVRELERHVRRHAPPELLALLAKIEKVAYSREAPTPTELREIEREAAVVVNIVESRRAVISRSPRKDLNRGDVLS